MKKGLYISKLGKISNSQKGFSLIELLIVVTIIGIIAAIAVPNIIASRRAANEASAIATCRTVFSAQISYYTVQNKFSDTLGILKASSFLDSRVANGSLSGYKFELKQITSPAAVPLSAAYAFHAHPASVYSTTNPLGTGTRGFYIDSYSGVIYSTIASAASFPPDPTAPTDSNFTPIK